MNNQLLVYDEGTKQFRDLDKSNYNDDIIIGTLFFSRDALSVLQKHFHICGYVLIDEDGQWFPIDIHETEIVMFEGSYNCMPQFVKKELIPFNLHKIPTMIWSSFFIRWQLLGDWNVFDDCNPFILMCSYIMDGNERQKIFLKQENSLVFPQSYEELCVIVQMLHELFGVDFYNSDYIEQYNYVVDSMLCNYHMRMKTIDIIKYCYQICNVVIKKWKVE